MKLVICCSSGDLVSPQGFPAPPNPRIIPSLNLNPPHARIDHKSSRTGVQKQLQIPNDHQRHTTTSQFHGKARHAGCPQDGTVPMSVKGIGFD